MGKALSSSSGIEMSDEVGEAGTGSGLGEGGDDDGGESAAAGAQSRSSSYQRSASLSSFAAAEPSERSDKYPSKSGSLSTMESRRAEELAVGAFNPPCPRRCRSPSGTAVRTRAFAKYPRNNAADALDPHNQHSEPQDMKMDTHVFLRFASPTSLSRWFFA